MARSLLCLLFAPAMCLYAQAPNPSGAGLDWVQQSFPTEAARVLGYVRNGSGAKIATIAATLERADAKGAAWKVTWQDAAGKPIRERTVTVDASRIEEGLTFYRDVFQQLAGEDWAIQSTSPDNSATAFWQGAELGAVSRTEAITAANKLMTDKPRVERASDAARLAGVLIHSALPSIAGQRPIDARLLGRGAAWLCICEKRLHEPLAAGWAPILYLAGRESEARDVWQSPEAVIKLRTVPERFWAMALTKGSAQDAFTFAARRENRSWAIPALYLHLRKDTRLAAPAREVAESLDRELVSRSHDYPLLLSDRAPSDAAWERLRKEFPGTAEPSRGLAPVAHFATADLADAGRPASSGVTGGRIADLTDEQIGALAREAIAAAAAAPDVAPTATTASGKPGLPERDLLDAPPPLTTADEMWTYLEKLKAGPGPAGSPEDGMRRMRAWLERQRSTAEQFAGKYPQDVRRWEAVTIGVEAAIRQKQFDQGQGKDDCQKLLDEVIEAPTASREVKGSASFLRIVLDLGDVNGRERHTIPPFHRKLTEFLDAYPEHPRAADAATLQLQLLESGETPGADKILEKLSKHSNPRIALQAKRVLAERARFVELKKQPLDLKFMAIDGSEVNFAKLRGKVVLLDFWASWCGPCMAEAPHVVATYQKLHERGFEIVGICLDQDKAAMTAAIQRAGLAWPHHFDGKGWENEIAQRFGIRSIPATWLFDRQGKLRTTGLRGQELEAGVERLLKE